MKDEITLLTQMLFVITICPILLDETNISEPFISNTDNEINHAILDERDTACGLDMNHEFLIQHTNKRNFTE